MGAMRRHCPQRAPRSGLPEPKLAISATTDEHGAVRGERGIDEEARAAAVRTLELSYLRTPEPHSSIAACGDDLASCDEARRVHLSLPFGVKLSDGLVVLNIP